MDGTHADLSEVDPVNDDLAHRMVVGDALGMPDERSAAHFVPADGHTLEAGRRRAPRNGPRKIKKHEIRAGRDRRIRCHPKIRAVRSQR